MNGTHGFHCMHCSRIVLIASVLFNITLLPVNVGNCLIPLMLGDNVQHVMLTTVIKPRTIFFSKLVSSVFHIGRKIQLLSTKSLKTQSEVADSLFTA